MTLHDLLFKWIDEYSDILKYVKENSNYKNPFRDIISKKIPDKISELTAISSPYKIIGSYGKGRWTDVPWIAILDTRITNSTQRGVYIVYLLNKDTKTLYLTLNQGATVVAHNDPLYSDNKYSNFNIALSSNPQMTERLEENASNLRSLLNISADNPSSINSGSPPYDAGCICNKKYTLDALPNDAALISDLKEYMDLYSLYYDKFINRISPSNNKDHKTGKFYSWEIIDELNAIKNCDKSFFEYNSSGVPQEICWFFDAESLPYGNSKVLEIIYEGTTFTAKFSNDTTDRKRAHISWNNDLGNQFSSYIRSNNVQAHFTKISSNKYQIALTADSEVEDTMNTYNNKEIIAAIANYINYKGFSYEEGLIKNLYLSLKAKPFVILAGISGTGKTKLVKLFAEAIGANTDNGHFKLVSVRPDWSDSSDLFGHVDINGNFISGSIIDFIKTAELDKSNPYFLCLDEMNLARVEHYFSDFLSVMETREHINGRIITDPLISDSYYGSDHMAAEKYGTIRIPENLYIIGTVNMDETTFPFSRKVLDRANTIEFSHVNLIPDFDTALAVSPIKVNNSFLRSDYLILKDCIDEKDIVENYCAKLEEINNILKDANSHIGYRVRDEIIFYMIYNNANNLLSDNDAFDYEIMQKILPRIQGSSYCVKNMLCDLFKLCAGDFEGYQTHNDDISSKMFKVIDNENCVYKRSAEKIAFMVRRFEEDGFTSYWL